MKSFRDDFEWKEAAAAAQAPGSLFVTEVLAIVEQVMARDEERRRYTEPGASSRRKRNVRGKGKSES